MSFQDHNSPKRGLFYFVVLIAVVFGLQIGWLYYAWRSAMDLLLPSFLLTTIGLMLVIFTRKALKS